MKTMEEKYSLFKSNNVYVSVQVISDVKRFVYVSLRFWVTYFVVNVKLAFFTYCYCTQCPNVNLL